MYAFFKDSQMKAGIQKTKVSTLKPVPHKVTVIVLLEMCALKEPQANGSDMSTVACPTNFEESEGAEGPFSASHSTPAL
jgi:hypothetical protein